MFGTLRNTFQTVQEGISASIRGLTAAERTKQKKSNDVRRVNYDAGADVLHRFQLQWNELHELAEENAGMAQEADALVSSVYETLEQEWNNFACLNKRLACIPKINDDIQTLMGQIETLQEVFQDVEEAIHQLEDLNETLELQNKQLDHRLQLALYKEKKLSELNSMKANLADEHMDRVTKYEIKHQKTLKERRETFDKVFKEEIHEYKTTGSIPKLPMIQQGPSLDEITLDIDRKIFDEFLEN